MEDLITYIITFASNLPAIQDLVFIASGGIGFFSVTSALYYQISNGRRGDTPSSAFWAMLFIGSLMLTLQSLVGAFSTTLLGEGIVPVTVTDLQVSQLHSMKTSGDTVRGAIHTIALIVNLIGWIAATRGLIRWNYGPKYQQPGWFGSGLTFVIAGALCTNLYAFADAIAVSIGAIPVATTYFKLS